MSDSMPMRAEGLPLGDTAGMDWIGDIPFRWAAARPERAAIIVPEQNRSVSFADLATLVGRFVAIMQARGVPPGARIGYLGRNSDLYFVALFGAIAGRFVLVPLNWRCAPPEIAFMLENAETALVVSDAEFLPLIEQAISATPALANLPTLRTEGEGSLRGALAEAGPAVGPASHDPGQICLLLYTSGTTGRPKGVLLSHEAVSVSRHMETVSPDWADWTGQDVILSALPSFHIGGMAWMLIGLIRGLTCVLTADASVTNVLDLIDRYAVSRTFIVPTVLRAMLELLAATGRPPPPIRTITYGAAVIGEGLLREAITVIGCGFAQYFGMTECAGTICFLPAADHDLTRPQLLTSVGRPQCGVAVEIRDADGTVLPAGQAGEIWVRTPALMTGYWRLPEATAAAIVDGWYRTGDGGRLDPQGYLTITDRIRDMIISGGENIYPVQVEEVLRQHPDVRDAAVVGVADERWGERVVAVVERHAEAVVTEEGLIGFAQLHLARYKCPKAIVFVEALPRTAMGKVQRALVRAVAAR
jgi:acyl-CoA synthetase (AMP-forming)/AMP-acid ligase II